jgi:hypothetical protein
MTKQSVWRASAMLQFYSVRPNTDTPTPFCEIRAFKYLLAQPLSLAETTMIRKELEKAIDDLLYRAGMQKALGTAIGKGSVASQSMSNIEEQKYEQLPSGRIKVITRGFEKEYIDIEEFISSGMVDTHIENPNRNVSRDIRHYLMKTIPTKMRFNHIFRYVAFYTPEGKIRGEYDELDILQGALD